MDRVQLNGKLRVDNDTLPINAINQICSSSCPVVLFTPRFGRRTLTRRAYEFTLKKLTLPLTGKYASRFVVTDVNRRGNSTIPSDGVVLAIEPRLGTQLGDKKLQHLQKAHWRLRLRLQNGKAFNTGSVATYGSSGMVGLNQNSLDLVRLEDVADTHIGTVPRAIRAVP